MLIFVPGAFLKVENDFILKFNEDLDLRVVILNHTIAKTCVMENLIPAIQRETYINTHKLHSRGILWIYGLSGQLLKGKWKQDKQQN